MAGVGEERLQERIHSEQCRKHQDPAVAILVVFGMNDGVHSKPSVSSHVSDG
jgi:hypothetical protein